MSFFDQNKSFVLPSIGWLGFTTFWFSLSYWEIVPAIFLPSPSSIVQSFIDLYNREWLLPAIINSFRRVGIALLLVSIVGIPVGTLLAVLPRIDAVTKQLLSAFKSIPITGLLGLIILWFSIGELAKVVFLFLGAIFYVIILVRSAIQRVDAVYISTAKELGATKFQLITKVLLPCAMPAMLDAIIVANGLMWTYIVLAEFISSSQENIGLGYLIYIGSRTQNSAMIFCSLIVIGALSVSTDWFLTKLRHRLFKWNE